MSAQAELLSAAERDLAAEPLLAGLPAADVRRLAALAEPFELAAGERLFRQGDPGDTLYVLVRGRLDMFTRAGGGGVLAEVSVQAPTIVGEMAAIANRPRGWTAVAAEGVAGWRLPAQAVAFLTATPESFAVVRRFGVLAVQRLREQYERLAGRLGGDPRVAVPARPSSLDLSGPVLPVAPEAGETEYLRTLLFFAAFPAEELEALFGGLRRLEAPRGATLVEQGERPPALLAVLRGAVETTIRRGGAAARARLAGPGRFAAHLGVLDEGPSPVTCRARERTILLELPGERVLELVTDFDRPARRFTLGLYTDLVDALHQSQRPFARMAASGG